MSPTELKKIATTYVKKALKTSEGKDPSPSTIKKTVEELVSKFTHVVNNT